MQRAPGQRLLAVARRLLSHEELNRLIEPAIADLQHEWQVSARLAISRQRYVRMRAYLGAWRVIGPRLMVASAQAGVEPPRWSAIRPLLGPALVTMSAIVLVGAFGPASARTREHWLFYLPDRVLWYLPLTLSTVATLPRARFQSTPQLRARELAQLTVIACVSCLGLGASQLWSSGVGTTISCLALVAWFVLLRVGGFGTPHLSAERMAAEWLSLAALLALAFMMLRWIARVERIRRVPLEARVLELLRALGEAKIRQHGSARVD